MTDQERTDTRTTWWANVATIVAGLILMTCSVAYYLTVEPSVRIGVRWREGVSVEQRAALERRFRLVNGLSTDDRFRYDLLDTRRENIKALIENPNTEDTESVSRTLYVAPPDISYGESWMWVAYRIPGLRAPGAMETIVVICFVTLVAGAWRFAQGRRIRKDV